MGHGALGMGNKNYSLFPVAYSLLPVKSYLLPITYYFSLFLVISRSQVQPGNDFWEVLPPVVQDMS